MFSGQSQNKTSPLFSILSNAKEKILTFFKHLSQKSLFGLVSLLFLIVGSAAALVLIKLNQDIRQQARLADYECQTASDCGDSSQWRCVAGSCVRRSSSLTPTPIPKNCGWGAHGSTACAGWNSCVECVDGKSVSVDRSKCGGQACAPQHSCGSSPHGSHACSSLNQCVVCDDGVWRSTGSSGCAGQACGPNVTETADYQDKLARYQDGELHQMCVENTGSDYLCRSQSEDSLLRIVFPELNDDERAAIREDHHDSVAAEYELEQKLDRYQQGELIQMCAEMQSINSCMAKSEDELLATVFPELNSSQREAVKEDHHDYVETQYEQEKLKEDIERYDQGELHQMCVEKTGSDYLCSSQTEDSLLRIVFPDLSDADRTALKEGHHEAVRQEYEAERVTDILTDYIQGDASSLNAECLSRHDEQYCSRRTEKELIAEFAPGLSDQETQDLVNQHDQSVTIANQEAQTQEQIRVDYIFHQTYGALEMPQTGDTVATEGGPTYVYGADGWEEVRSGEGVAAVYNTLKGGEPKEGDTIVVDGKNYTYKEVCNTATYAGGGCQMTWQEDDIFKKGIDWLSDAFNQQNNLTAEFEQQEEAEPEFGDQIVVDGEVYEYKVIDHGMGAHSPGWSKIGVTGERQDNPEEEYDQLYASVLGEPEVGSTVTIDGKTYYYYGEDDGWDLSRSSSDLALYYNYTTGANVEGQLADRCREAGGDSDDCNNSEYALGVVYPNLSDESVAEVVDQRYEDVIERVLSSDITYDTSELDLGIKETVTLNTFRGIHSAFGDSTTKYVADPNLANSVELGTKLGVSIGAVVAAPVTIGAATAAQAGLQLAGTISRTWMITSSAYSLGETTSQALSCDDIADAEARSRCKLESGLGIVSSAAGLVAPALGTSSIDTFRQVGQYAGITAGASSTLSSGLSTQSLCEKDPDSAECKWSKANTVVSGLGFVAGAVGVAGQRLPNETLSAGANLGFGLAADVGGGIVDYNRSRQACIESGGDPAACTRAVLDTLAGLGMAVDEGVRDWNEYQRAVSGGGSDTSVVVAGEDTFRAVDQDGLVRTIDGEIMAGLTDSGNVEAVVNRNIDLNDADAIQLAMAEADQVARTVQGEDGLMTRFDADAEADVSSDRVGLETDVEPIRIEIDGEPIRSEGVDGEDIRAGDAETDLARIGELDSDADGQRVAEDGGNVGIGEESSDLARLVAGDEAGSERIQDGNVERGDEGGERLADQDLARTEEGERTTEAEIEPIRIEIDGETAGDDSNAQRTENADEAGDSDQLADSSLHTDGERVVDDADDSRQSSTDDDSDRTILERLFGWLGGDSGESRTSTSDDSDSTRTEDGDGNTEAEGGGDAEAEGGEQLADAEGSGDDAQGDGQEADRTDRTDNDQTRSDEASLEEGEGESQNQDERATEADETAVEESRDDQSTRTEEVAEEHARVAETEEAVAGQSVLDRLQTSLGRLFAPEQTATRIAESAEESRQQTLDAADRQRLVDQEQADLILQTALSQADCVQQAGDAQQAAQIRQDAQDQYRADMENSQTRFEQARDNAEAVYQRAMAEVRDIHNSLGQRLATTVQNIRQGVSNLAARVASVFQRGETTNLPQRTAEEAEQIRQDWAEASENLRNLSEVQEEVRIAEEQLRANEERVETVRQEIEQAEQLAQVADDDASQAENTTAQDPLADLQQRLAALESASLDLQQTIDQGRQRAADLLQEQSQQVLGDDLISQTTSADADQLRTLAEELRTESGLKIDNDGLSGAEDILGRNPGLDEYTSLNQALAQQKQANLLDAIATRKEQLAGLDDASSAEAEVIRSEIADLTEAIEMRVPQIANDPLAQAQIESIIRSSELRAGQAEGIEFFNTRDNQVATLVDLTSEGWSAVELTTAGGKTFVGGLEMQIQKQILGKDLGVYIAKPGGEADVAKQIQAMIDPSETAVVFDHQRFSSDADYRQEVMSADYIISKPSDIEFLRNSANNFDSSIRSEAVALYQKMVGEGTDGVAWYVDELQINMDPSRQAINPVGESSNPLSSAEIDASIVIGDILSGRQADGSFDSSQAIVRGDWGTGSHDGLVIRNEDGAEIARFSDEKLDQIFSRMVETNGQTGKMAELGSRLADVDSESVAKALIDLVRADATEVNLLSASDDLLLVFVSQKIEEIGRMEQSATDPTEVQQLSQQKQVLEKIVASGETALMADSMRNVLDQVDQINRFAQGLKMIYETDYFRSKDQVLSARAKPGERLQDAVTIPAGGGVKNEGQSYQARMQAAMEYVGAVAQTHARGVGAEGTTVNHNGLTASPTNAYRSSIADVLGDIRSNSSVAAVTGAFAEGAGVLDVGLGMQQRTSSEAVVKIAGDVTTENGGRIAEERSFVTSADMAGVDKILGALVDSGRLETSAGKPADGNQKLVVATDQAGYTRGVADSLARANGFDTDRVYFVQEGGDHYVKGSYDSSGNFRIAEDGLTAKDVQTYYQNSKGDGNISIVIGRGGATGDSIKTDPSTIGITITSYDTAEGLVAQGGARHDRGDGVADQYAIVLKEGIRIADGEAADILASANNFDFTDFRNSIYDSQQRLIQLKTNEGLNVGVDAASTRVLSDLSQSSDRLIAEWASGVLLRMGNQDGGRMVDLEGGSQKSLEARRAKIEAEVNKWEAAIADLESNNPRILESIKTDYPDQYQNMMANAGRGDSGADPTRLSYATDVDAGATKEGVMKAENLADYIERHNEAVSRDAEVEYVAGSGQRPQSVEIADSRVDDGGDGGRGDGDSEGGRTTTDDVADTIPAGDSISRARQAGQRIGQVIDVVGRALNTDGVSRSRRLGYALGALSETLRGNYGGAVESLAGIREDGQERVVADVDDQTNEQAEQDQEADEDGDSSRSEQNNTVAYRAGRFVRTVADRGLIGAVSDALRGRNTQTDSQVAGEDVQQETEEREETRTTGRVTIGQALATLTRPRQTLGTIAQVWQRAGQVEGVDSFADRWRLTSAVVADILRNDPEAALDRLAIEDEENQADEDESVISEEERDEETEASQNISFARRAGQFVRRVADRGLLGVVSNVLGGRRDNESERTADSETENSNEEAEGQGQSIAYRAGRFVFSVWGAITNRSNDSSSDNSVNGLISSSTGFRVSVGRTSDNAVVLDDDYISANHLDIIGKHDGTIVVVDRNSTNGTFLNGEQLTPNQESPNLVVGDSLKIGYQVYQVTNNGLADLFGNLVLRFDQKTIVLQENTNYVLGSGRAVALSCSSQLGEDLLAEHLGIRVNAGRLLVSNLATAGDVYINETMVDSGQEFFVGLGDVITLRAGDQAIQITISILNDNTFALVAKNPFNESLEHIASGQLDWLESKSGEGDLASLDFSIDKTIVANGSYTPTVGDEVYVRRSNGTIERGWVVNRHLYDDIYELVKDRQKEGDRLVRATPLTDIFSVDQIEHSNNELVFADPVAESKRLQFILEDSTSNDLLSDEDYYQLFVPGLGILQQNVGDCYLIGALNSLVQADYFKALAKLSIRRDGDGWSVRVPLSDSSGQWIHVSTSDLRAQRNPNYGANDSRLWLEPIKASRGYQILEAAYAIAISNDGQVHRNQIEGGYGHRALQVLLGRDFTKRKITSTSQESGEVSSARDTGVMYGIGAPFSQGAAASRAALSDFFGDYDHNKYIATANTPPDLQGDTVEFTINGKTFYKSHAYSITDVDRFNQTVTVVNPHNSAYPIELTFTEFQQVFCQVSSVAVDYSALFVAEELRVMLGYSYTNQTGLDGTVENLSSEDADHWQIGRNEDSDVVVGDGRVSRTHAEIELRNDGFYIRDSGSTNGTYVNGEEIGNEWAPIIPHDEVSLGGAVFVFHGLNSATGEIILREKPVEQLEELSGDKLESEEVGFILVDEGELDEYGKAEFERELEQRAESEESQESENQALALLNIGKKSIVKYQEPVLDLALSAFPSGNLIDEAVDASTTAQETFLSLHDYAQEWVASQTAGEQQAENQNADSNFLLATKGREIVGLLTDGMGETARQTDNPTIQDLVASNTLSLILEALQQRQTTSVTPGSELVPVAMGNTSLARIEGRGYLDQQPDREILSEVIHLPATTAISQTQRLWEQYLQYQYAKQLLKTRMANQESDSHVLELEDKSQQPELLSGHAGGRQYPLAVVSSNQPMSLMVLTELISLGNSNQVSDADSLTESSKMPWLNDWLTSYLNRLGNRFDQEETQSSPSPIFPLLLAGQTTKQPELLASYAGGRQYPLAAIPLNRPSALTVLANQFSRSQNSYLEGFLTTNRRTQEGDWLNSYLDGFADRLNQEEEPDGDLSFPLLLTDQRTEAEIERSNEIASNEDEELVEEEPAKAAEAAGAKEMSQLAANRRVASTFEELSRRCGSSNFTHLLDLIGTHLATEGRTKFHYGDIGSTYLPIYPQYIYEVVLNAFGIVPDTLVADAQTRKYQGNGVILEQERVNSTTISLLFRGIDDGVITDDILMDARSYLTTLPHAVWLKQFAAMADLGEDRQVFEGVRMPIAENSSFELAAMASTLFNRKMADIHEEISSFLSSGEKSRRFELGEVGITLELDINEAGVRPVLIINRNQLDENGNAPYFSESETFVHIVEGLKTAGLRLKPRFESALLEDEQQYGYTSRYGNGYVDLTRKITEQIGKTPAEAVQAMFEGETAESVLEKIAMLPASDPTTPDGLVFHLIRSLFDSSRSLAQDDCLLDESRSIKDGSCRDAETYYLQSREIELRDRNVQMLFKSEGFVEKRGHGSNTAISTQPITVQGVTFPTGYLFHIGEQGVRPLRPTMACFSESAAADAFGWQYRETQESSGSQEVVKDLQEQVISSDNLDQSEDLGVQPDNSANERLLSLRQRLFDIFKQTPGLAPLAYTIEKVSDADLLDQITDLWDSPLELVHQVTRTISLLPATLREGIVDGPSISLACSKATSLQDLIDNLAQFNQDAVVLGVIGNQMRIIPVRDLINQATAVRDLVEVDAPLESVQSKLATTALYGVRSSLTTLAEAEIRERQIEQQRLKREYEADIRAQQRNKIEGYKSAEWGSGDFEWKDFIDLAGTPIEGRVSWFTDRGEGLFPNQLVRLLKDVKSKDPALITEEDLPVAPFRERVVQFLQAEKAKNLSEAEQTKFAAQAALNKGLKSIIAQPQTASLDDVKRAVDQIRANPDSYVGCVFALLELDQSATESQVKSAKRRAMNIYHPDKYDSMLKPLLTTDPEYAERKVIYDKLRYIFALVNEAEEMIAKFRQSNQSSYRSDGYSWRQTTIDLHEEVEKASNWNELYSALQAVNFDQVYQTIKRVRVGQADISEVTPQYGIRDKVEELMAQDRRWFERQIQMARSWADLYQVLTNFGYSHVINMIEQVRHGSLSLDFLSSEYGIKAKVRELLDQERVARFMDVFTKISDYISHSHPALQPWVHLIRDLDKAQRIWTVIQNSQGNFDTIFQELFFMFENNITHKIVYGRTSGDVLINDSYVSSVHAEVGYTDFGEVYIRDLGSSNSTYVNGEERNYSWLHEGDQVRMGETRFVVIDDSGRLTLQQVFDNQQQSQNSESNIPHAEPIVFGRDNLPGADATIKIDHVRIAKTDEGKLMIIDDVAGGDPDFFITGENLVERQALTNNSDIILEDGDMITLGAYELFVFKEKGEYYLRTETGHVLRINDSNELVITHPHLEEAVDLNGLSQKLGELFSVPRDSSRASYGYGSATDANPEYRRSMEDGHVVVENFRGRQNEFFAGVYDGHAGDGVAKHLQSVFHNMLENNFEKGLGVVDALRRTYYQVDYFVRRLGLSSGATVASVYIRDNQLYASNLGDARAVLSRAGNAQRLTHDHKSNDEAEMKRVQENGGFLAWGRIQLGRKSINIARTIGDWAFKGLYRNWISTTARVSEIDLSSKDEFVILACDGLWDVIDDQQAVDLIKDIADPAKAAELLKQKALEEGSKDNISVIVVRLKPAENK